MKKFRLTFPLLLLAGLALPGCLDNKDDDNTEERLAFVTLEDFASWGVSMREDDGSLIEAEVQTGDKYTTVNTTEGLKKGGRYYAHYRKKPLPYRLYAISEVETPALAELTRDNAEALGRDSAYYLGLLYVGGGYLNVTYQSKASERTLTAAYDTLHVSNADTTYLRLCFSAGGDMLSTERTTAVSFDLDAVKPAPGDTMVVQVRSTSLQSGKYVSSTRNLLYIGQEASSETSD